MPKPKKSEGKQDFLKRCTEELITAEKKKPDQAFAMCNSYWAEANLSLSSEECPTVTLSAPIALDEGEEEGGKGQGKRAFLINAHTGQVIDKYWRRFIISLKGIKANNNLPVLREHSPSQVVGHTKKTTIREEGFQVSGIATDATEAGREVVALADEGFPWQASVTLNPLKIRRLQDEKEKATVNGMEVEGPIDIYEETEIHEVSFCVLGADKDTAAVVLNDGSTVQATVEIEAGPVETLTPTETEEGQSMPFTIETLQAEHPEILKQVQDAAREEGVQDERSRVTEILQAGADSKATLEAIESGMELSAAYKAFYEAEKTNRSVALEKLADTAPRPTGAEPPEDPGGGGEEQTTETFEDKVEALVSEGKSRAEATREAVNLHPDLHEQYLDRMEENGRKRKRAAA